MTQFEKFNKKTKWQQWTFYEGKWEWVGPWKYQFLGPNLLPLTLVMELLASKALTYAGAV
jgi:uncharacterized iron-regulated protein